MAADRSGGIMSAILDTLYFRNPVAEVLLYLFMALASLGTLALVTALRGRQDGWLGRYAARVTPAYPYILLQAGVMLLIGLEAAVELQVTAWLGWDFTPLVYAVEGRLVERFQDALHTSAWGPYFDSFFVLVYTWGAFLLTVVPFLTLVFTGRVASLRRVTFTLAIVWAVGLVFYLFFPVYEVWVTASAPYHYTHTKNILIERSPGLLDATIYQLNLNNNFPSLHTGVAAANVIALYYAREKWLFRLGAPIATGVIIATVYLGIHWLVDLIAGLALAWGAAYYVHRREVTRAHTVSLVPRAAAVGAVAAEPRER